MFADLALFSRLHEREMDGAAIERLQRCGFPDDLSLPAADGAAEEAFANMRRQLTCLSMDLSCRRNLARDYAKIYLAADCLDSAGRVMRYGDQFLSQFNVLRQLVADGLSGGKGLGLRDYLAQHFLPTADSFREWANCRGRVGFYGALADLTAGYGRSLHGCLPTEGRPRWPSLVCSGER